MKEIAVDQNLVGYCGLYCGACRAYLRERCPGCHDNAKAGWCKVRTCCMERQYASCADCTDYADARDCAKFSNFVARVFGFIFRSDRAACIQQIRELGLQAHAEKMAASGRQSIRR